MTNPNIWNQLLIWPITNVLIAFYKLFEWLHIPWPLGWAVILMTITIRLILYPVMNAQLKSAKKMSDLKPQLDALNAKHKDDKTALQQAQLALYKENGVNPAAGCLPLLIQMPVLIALYNVFYQLLNSSDMTKVITEVNHIVYAPWLKLTHFDLTFFGTNLAIKPSQWQSHGWWLFAIPILTGLLQWYQSKLMLPKKTDEPVAVPPVQIKGKQSKHIVPLKEAKDEKKPESDTAAEMQKQMAILSPLMFAYFAFQFPLGLALYWNVFGIFGIMQQLRVNKASK